MYLESYLPIKNTFLKDYLEHYSMMGLTWYKYKK